MKKDNLVILEKNRANKALSKTKKNKLIFRHGILLAGILIMGYFFYALGSPVIKTQSLEKEIAAIETEIKLFKEKNEKLKEQIEFEKTDTYVERVAREKLGLIKPGEVLIVPSESEETK